MKILVTGGAGFIGSHLVDKLIELGHEVVCIDNFLTGNKKNLNPKAKFYEGDIRDQDKLEEIFSKEKPEYVFHTAAGYLVQSNENPQRDAEINIIGSINIILMCLKYNVKKLIYSNSGGASYGEPLQIPMTEEHSINPLTPYGASKHTVEHYLYMYHKNHGLNYTSLRYANVYGPRQNPKLEGGVISVFLDALLRGERPVMKSDGTPTRDYVYVGDVVDANIAAMEKGGCEGYHVSTGIETSVIDLFNTMKKVVNSNLDVIKGPPRIGDPQRAVFDNSKIKAGLQWEPKVTLEEGMQKTAEWLKNEIKNEGNKIKGLILAAGIGERMHPLTKNTPKPMLKIAEKPVLDYLLRLFKRYGLNNVGITTYYLKNQIIDYFKNGEDIGMNLIYLEEPELIPSGRAIKQMVKHMGDWVVITNGDNLTNINLEKVIENHKSKGADITIVSYLRKPEDRPSSQLDFDENMRLFKFREKMTEEEMAEVPIEKRNANMGVYVFNKKVLETLSDDEEEDLGKIFPRFLEKGFKIYVYPLEKEAYFKEIGKLERFNKAKEEIESGEVVLNI